MRKCLKIVFFLIFSKIESKTIITQKSTAFSALLSPYFENLQSQLNDECLISKTGPCDLEEVDEVFEKKYFTNELARQSFIKETFRRYKNPCDFKECNPNGSLMKQEKVFDHCSCVCKNEFVGELCDKKWNMNNDSKPENKNKLNSDPRGDLISVVDIDAKGSEYEFDSNSDLDWDEDDDDSQDEDGEDDVFGFGF